MKKSLLLNIGNYENTEHETSEYDNERDCYLELYLFLHEWVGITDNAAALLRRMLPIWKKYNINGKPEGEY